MPLSLLLLLLPIHQLHCLTLLHYCHQLPSHHLQPLRHYYRHHPNPPIVLAHCPTLRHHPRLAALTLPCGAAVAPKPRHENQDQHCTCRHTRVRCVVYVLNDVLTVHTPHDPFVHLFLLIVSTVLLNTYFSLLATFEFWFGRQASKQAGLLVFVSLVLGHVMRRALPHLHLPML